MVLSKAKPQKSLPVFSLNYGITRQNANMSDGIICTAEELSLSISSKGVTIACLTRTQSVGLALATQSGFISFFSIILAFILVFVSNDGVCDPHSLRVNHTSTGIQRKNFKRSHLIGRPNDLYMVSHATGHKVLLKLIFRAIAFAILIRSHHGARMDVKCQMDPGGKAVYRQLLYGAR